MTDDLIRRQDAIMVVKDQRLEAIGCIPESYNAGVDASASVLEMIPSAQPEFKPVTAEEFAKTMSENSLYNFVTWHQEALTLMKEQGFIICKKDDVIYRRAAIQQWIPCSERLPSHDEYIKNNGLFNVSDGDRSYSEWYDNDKLRFGEPTMSGFRVDYAVIAWMPLPEPYEVEE